MAAMAQVPFTKTALPYADQVALLMQRGLVIDDPAAAERTLASISYYRALLRKPVSRRHDPSPGRTHATATTGTVCGRPI
jgi:hypothetical protein